MRWVAVIPLVLGFALLAPASALAAPPDYYPPIDWIPAARSNYDTGRSMAITAIVIHETDGSYLSALNWFKNPRSHVSSHYLVRAWGGGITQFVAEGDTAFHARAANPWTIGIEHEYNPRQAIWHTDAQYRSSALLVCAIAKRYGIPIDRKHIVGHNELPGTDHSDPGPTWNWNYYMSLVRGCSVDRAQAAARGGLRTIADNGYVPTAGLTFDDVSDEVSLLQWDLAYLGFMDPEEVSGGGARFGPLTEQALTAFQESKGVPTATAPLPHSCNRSSRTRQTCLSGTWTWKPILTRSRSSKRRSDASGTWIGSPGTSARSRRTPCRPSSKTTASTRRERTARSPGWLLRHGCVRRSPPSARRSPPSRPPLRRLGCRSGS